MVVCGEIPAELIYGLASGPSFTEKLIRQLKKRGLLRVYYRDKLRGKVMMKLLCNPDRRSDLDRIQFQDLKAGRLMGSLRMMQWTKTETWCILDRRRTGKRV